MSDTPTPGSTAEPAAAAAAAPAPAAPPETVAPQPVVRSPFVLVKPLLAPDKAIGAGELVSLTPAQATEHAALIRAATALDLSRWGRAPHEL